MFHDIKRKQIPNHQHIHHNICINFIQMIYYHLQCIMYINLLNHLNKNNRNNDRLSIISNQHLNVYLNIHIILSLNLFFYALRMDIIYIHHDFHWNNFHNYDDIKNKYFLKCQKIRYCIHICFHLNNVNH